MLQDELWRLADENRRMKDKIVALMLKHKDL